MEQPKVVQEVRKFGEGRCQTCGKPLVASSGDIGATCKLHQGKLRSTAKLADVVPEGYIRMSKVCRALETKGLSTHTIVKSCGGDACTAPVMEPLNIFQPTYVGGGKWLNPEMLTKGAELLLKAQGAPKAPKADAPKVGKADVVSATAAALKAHSVIKADKA